LFSLSFGNVVQRDIKETKQIQKVAEGMNNIANDKGSSLNGDIFGLSSWAKGLVFTKEISRAKATDERNWFDTDIKTTKVSDLSSWAKRTLFHRFESVHGIPSADFHHVSKQGAVHAQLAGTVYQDMIPNVPILGHSMVVKGTSADVKWMVTTATLSQPRIKKQVYRPLFVLSPFVVLTNLMRMSTEKDLSLRFAMLVKCPLPTTYQACKSTGVFWQSLRKAMKISSPSLTW
jgi:hypothetical protein